MKPAFSRSIAALALSLSLLGAGCGSTTPVQTQGGTDVGQPTQTEQGNGNGSTVTTTEASYSMADVQAHNSDKSCWTAINGNVYDVTAWINQHPGGAETILSLCGIDGSSAFNDQHGGQRRPESELASFKIGSLK